METNEGYFCEDCGAWISPWEDHPLEDCIESYSGLDDYEYDGVEDVSYE